MDEDIKKILDKYQNKIKENIEIIDEYNPDEGFTREYKIFREEALSATLSNYEKICNSIGDKISVKLKDDDYKKLNDSIEAIHLEITPEQASGFAVFISIVLIFLSLGLAALL